MKSSEKIGLLLKGVKMEEIKQLEAEEAKEVEEAAAASKTTEVPVAKTEESNEEIKSALESAKQMLEDLEAKVNAKDDEIKKLNDALADLNNKQTIAEKPTKVDSAADVMQQLFKPKKED